MNVARWKAGAEFFPWAHVQRAIDGVDSTVYRAAVRYAQDQFQSQARPCPQCGRSAIDLSWFSVTDPEPAWDQGTGRVGFLTFCERCRLQVDFLVDPELTELQAAQWRTDRTLA